MYAYRYTSPYTHTHTPTHTCLWPNILIICFGFQHIHDSISILCRTHTVYCFIFSFLFFHFPYFPPKFDCHESFGYGRKPVMEIFYSFSKFIRVIAVQSIPRAYNRSSKTVGIWLNLFFFVVVVEFFDKFFLYFTKKKMEFSKVLVQFQSFKEYS